MASFYISDPKVLNLLTIDNQEWRIYSYICQQFNAKELKSFIRLVNIAGQFQISLETVQKCLDKLSKIEVEGLKLISIEDTGSYLKFDMPRHKAFIQSLGFKKYNTSRGWRTLKQHVSPEVKHNYKFADLDQYQLEEKLSSLPLVELNQMKDSDQPAAPIWPAASVEMWTVEELHPYARNSRTHPEEQIEQIMGSIRRFGFTIPILVSEDGTIIAGHGRLEAATRLGLPEVPVMVARGWSEDMARAYTIADNRLAETSAWDDELLRLELRDLGIDEDSGLMFDMGFNDDDLNAILGAAAVEAENEGDGASANRAEARATLAEQFGAVPFSVLNAREGWWMDRKRAWLSLGIRSEVGRGENLLGFSETLQEPDPEKRARMKNGKRKAAAFGQDLMRGEGRKYSTGGVLIPSPSGSDPQFYKKKQEAEARLGRELSTAEFIEDHWTPPEGAASISTTGTSIFDPVLTELCYRWFSPRGGQILDPFAGGSVRGIVASALGREYTGIELRTTRNSSRRIGKSLPGRWIACATTASPRSSSARCAARRRAGIATLLRTPSRRSATRGWNTTTR